MASTNGRSSRAVARRPTRTIAAAPSRVEVRKTYKLYIGGQFPRSESGRSYVVGAADGTPLANAVRSSRKDLRDAVRAARTESRRSFLEARTALASGVPSAAATT